MIFYSFNNRNGNPKTLQITICGHLFKFISFTKINESVLIPGTFKSIIIYATYNKDIKYVPYNIKFSNRLKSKLDDHG